VLRLLRGISTEELAERMRRVFDDERSAEPARRGMVLLRELFGRGGEGAEMAARALAGVIKAAEVRLSCEVLAGDLLTALDSTVE
jgi:hypothetical protein